MLSSDALRTMRVMIATPCYGAATAMHYAASLFRLSREATLHGLDLVLHLHSESLITRARNQVVAAFLADERCTHLFWIDADIAFEPRSVFKLLLADLDVVAGLYPLKREVWPSGGLPATATRQDLDALTTAYPLFPSQGGADGEVGLTADGFLDVAQAPTGFMVIRRRVFAILAERCPDLAYAPDPSQPAPAGLHWRFFDCMTDPATCRYLSEDYAFCRRWRDAGGRIFADLDCKLDHAGQRLHRGDLMRQLRMQGRVTT